MQTNEQLELAYQFVSQTDRHVFLTGKAGTGKTTFLHRVRERVPKRKVVVAPTGVAAINARGVTIHSQFQLPFGVLYPERLKVELTKHRLSNKKAEVLRNLDLLIIDEISMVRADMLDALSAVLCKYRRSKLPFGGVQLLMIGDLHQLPPVVKDADWEQLKEHYQTAYFFGSHELQRAGARTVQLTHIYRQSDATFIDLLNQVRTDQLDASGLNALNSRYRGPDFSPPPGDEYITLTSHNAQANRINARQLEGLTTPLRKFSCEVTGKFPESMYPNDPDLSFRVGAQVMFNKNDTSEQRYYNGKIGTVIAIGDEVITVACPGEEPISVYPVVWENRTFEVDKKSKEVTDEVIGTYTQHPLRLAWAITIHKSQGLTFERVIIDAGQAFAHGQVYVALSRCKTFEGIVLRSRIDDRSVRTDRVVSDYSDRATANSPTKEDLRNDRRRYQLNCLEELFNFTATDRSFAHLQRALLEHETALQSPPIEKVVAIRRSLREKVMGKAEGFRPHLKKYGSEPALPAEHSELQSRLRKAAAYFIPLLQEAKEALAKLVLLSDNTAARATVTERLDALRFTVLTKELGFASVHEGFDPDRYLRSRIEAEVKFKESSKPTPGVPDYSAISKNSNLYGRLREWRRQRAEQDEVPAYGVMHNSALLGVAAEVPLTKTRLLAIPGIGKKTVEKYGQDLLAVVEDYAASGGGVPIPLPPIKKGSATPKLNTREISLQAFRAGRSIQEIATERNLTEGTIFGHLTKFVAQGDLSAEEILDEKTLALLQAYFTTVGEVPLSEVHAHFAGRYSYGQLRVAKAALDASKLAPTEGT